MIAPNAAVALSFAVSTLKKNLSPSSWASTPALPLAPIPPSWWMIAGCVSAYIGSALHGFQLKLSGTCTQRPTEIKVGKQINMHGGNHSPKTNIPLEHTYTPFMPVLHVEFTLKHIYSYDDNHKPKKTPYIYMEFTKHLCSNTSHSHTYCPTWTHTCLQYMAFMNMTVHTYTHTVHHCEYPWLG